MVLTDVLKEKCEAQEYVFINARRDLANTHIDSIQDDKNVMVLFDWREEFIPLKSQLKSAFRCSVYILEKITLTDDIVAIDDAIQAQRVSAKKYLTAIRDDDRVKDMTSGNLLPAQNLFDSNYSGVDVEFVIELRDDDTEC